MSEVLAQFEVPRRKRGRQSAAGNAIYEATLARFCEEILKLRSTLDFDVSSRGWCYILEGKAGLRKGDFDDAQELINDCRKSGMLPLDIAAQDISREFTGIEEIDESTPEERAQHVLDYVIEAHLHYTPESFWEEQDVYVQMVVEKIDVKNLFLPVCEEFYIPIANAKGWSDINLRADMMRRFAEWEACGKQGVLLYCGDHDPGGLQISSFLGKNMDDLAGAVGWRPANLIIDRFGLNYDFIQQQRLTWIDNLETASGGKLDDPKHKDHNKAYVQDYIKRFGVRKVEANALVVRPAPARQFCREAILKYIDPDAPGRYRENLEPAREEMRTALDQLLQAERE